MIREPSLLFLARAALLLGAGAAAHAQSLTVLEALPGADEPFAAALAISADGAVVAGYARTPATAGGREASLWTTGPVPAGLGGFPTSNAWGHARGMSADGTTIVGSTSRANRLHAFRWSAANGLQKLPALPEAVASEARGVSLDGNVVAGRTDFVDESTSKAIRYHEATLWKNGQVKGLGFLPGGVKSEALDVSANGRVVVGAADPDAQKDGSTVAFLWTETTGMLSLGDLPGGYRRGVATAVDRRGDVVVGWGHTTFHPIEYRVFRWTRESGKMTELGALPGHFHAKAADVSMFGEYVVGWSSPDLSGTERRPFIWDETNGMRDVVELLENAGVDLSDWKDGSGRTWMEATGVSADGKTIVGFGRRFTDDVRRGWIAELP